jgi:hypothetical protein
MNDTGHHAPHVELHVPGDLNRGIGLVFSFQEGPVASQAKPFDGELPSDGDD